MILTIEQRDFKKKERKKERERKKEGRKERKKWKIQKVVNKLDVCALSAEGVTKGTL